MPRLLSQFDLRPDVSRQAFEAAWTALADHLLNSGLAAAVDPPLVRQPGSGFDTDDDRPQHLLTVITFRDQAQVDAAWKVIEDRADPTVGIHNAVLAMVSNPIFTFLDDA